MGTKRDNQQPEDIETTDNGADRQAHAVESVAEPEDVAIDEAKFAVAYDELRKLARRLRAKYDLPTLNATALVHEAFVRLANSPTFRACSTEHLMFTLITAMRRVLVDAARHKRRLKRGGPHRHVPLDETGAREAVDPNHVIAINRALLDLARAAPDQARVFEAWYFGAQSTDDIARLLNQHPKKVQRTLRLAKAAIVASLRGRPRAVGEEA